MTQNLRNQLKTESKRAKILSRQTVDAIAYSPTVLRLLGYLPNLDCNT